MWWTIVWWVATTVVSALLAPKPKGRPAATMDEFSAPTASESRGVNVLLGRRWLDDPNWLWYGNLRIVAITEKGGRKYGLFGPRNKVQVGEKFYLDGHLLLAHKLDRVLAIAAGDADELLASSLAVTTNATVSTNKPNLFGGDKKGGGVSGPLHFLFGAADQAPHAVLTAGTGAAIAYRDEVGVVLDQVYLGTSKYLPAFAFLAERMQTESNWYAAKRQIGDDMNPAHMIYEALTNRDWGEMGIPVVEIDDASFRAAADVLHAEGFGLSFKINSNGVSGEEFLYEIARHIDATPYEDPATGLWSITLHRDDYDPEQLLVLDGSNSRVERAHARVPQVTTIVVEYPDRDARRMRTTAPDCDLAAVEMIGGEVTEHLRFDGVATAALAQRIAARERAHRTRVAVECTLIATRVARDLRPGRLFRWKPPKLPYDLVMRVARVTPGRLDVGEIRIEAAQALGSESSTYAPPPPSGWTNPVQAPAAAPNRLVMESPYALLVAEHLGPELVADLTADQGLPVIAASGPSAGAIDYDAWGRIGAEAFAEIEAGGNFAGYAELSANASAAADTLAVQGASRWEDFEPGRLAAIVSGSLVELVRVVTRGSTSLTVDRGMIDTVPRAHAAGAKILSLNDPLYVDDTYLNAQALGLRVLPATLLGRLDVSVAPTDTLTFNRRQIRPYPPADLQLNGARWPAAVSGEVTLTALQRNRITQAGTLHAQTAAAVPHEAGTTYTARWWLDDVLVRTQSALATPTDTYTPAADGTLRVELEAVRDGYTSWHAQTHTCTYTVSPP